VTDVVRQHKQPIARGAKRHCCNPGVLTSLRRLFAKIRVKECNRDIASIGVHGSLTLKFLDLARRVVG